MIKNHVDTAETTILNGFGYAMRVQEVKFYDTLGL